LHSVQQPDPGRPRIASLRRADSVGGTSAIVSLDCVPKDAGPGNLAWICTATARDKIKAPIRGEAVCFTSDADRTLPGAAATPVSDPESFDRLCVETDANGEATVEVLARHLPIVVKAHFVGLGERERFTIETR